MKSVSRTLSEYDNSEIDYISPDQVDSRPFLQTLLAAKATACWQSQRKLTPDDLFLTVPRALVDE